VKVQLNSCYEDLIQENLNRGVPRYKSYMKEHEIKAEKQLTEEEKLELE
jgi:hypothetical protein